MKLSFAIMLSATFVLGPVQAQSPTAAPDEKTHSTEVPQVVAASNQDREWQPNADQRERALRGVIAYLAAKDSGRLADAYALFTPIQKSTVPFKSWEADMQSFYIRAGAAGGRTLKNITWYKNPVSGPPGIYAAVDFSSQFAALSLHCGYVAMQQQLDGSFGVAREEENSIPKSVMAKLTPEMLQKIRAQYRC